MRITGITPKSLAAALAARPASVQERWFSCLYFLKPAVFAVRDLAATAAAEGVLLPRSYHALFYIWSAFWASGVRNGIGHLWLMMTRPATAWFAD